MINPINTSRSSILLHPLSVLAFLGVTIWLAHFYSINRFGFYEDDYFVATQYLDKDFSAIGDLVITSFKKFPFGRPLAYSLPAFAACLAGKLGGVKVLYLFGFVVITLNAFLLYLLLNKCYQKSQLFGLAGALTYGLFPADTTKILLTHSLILQPALAFFLLATLCYVYGWKKLAYFCIAWSLLTYESTFLLFIGAPLLSELRGRHLFRELLRNLFLLGIMIVLVVIIRKLIGEVRITEVFNNPLIVFAKIVSGMCIGPLTTFFLFLRAPLVAISRWQEIPWIVPISWGVCLLGLLRYLVGREIPLDFAQRKSLITLRLRNIQLEEYCRMTFISASVGRLLLVGMVFLMLGYIASFIYYPPVYMYGRITSVHLAASFGGALVFACIFMLLWEGMRYHEQRTLVIGVSSAYLALLVGYHCMIQNEFASSWRYQRKFWPSVVELCPDFADNLVILVENDGLPETKYILTHSWIDPFIMRHMFQFPKEWKKPPRLFPIDISWKERVIVKGDKLTLTGLEPPFLWQRQGEVLPDGNVIILRQQNDKLIRLVGELKVKGQVLKLKDRPEIHTPVFPRGPFFNYLVENDAVKQLEIPIH